jgi:hypothetical protein
VRVQSHRVCALGVRVHAATACVFSIFVNERMRTVLSRSRGDVQTFHVPVAKHEPAHFRAGRTCPCGKPRRTRSCSTPSFGAVGHSTWASRRTVEPRERGLEVPQHNLCLASVLHNLARVHVQRELVLHFDLCARRCTRDLFLGRGLVAVDLCGLCIRRGRTVWFCESWARARASEGGMPSLAMVLLLVAAACSSRQHFSLLPCKWRVPSCYTLAHPLAHTVVGSRLSACPVIAACKTTCMHDVHRTLMVLLPCTHTDTH